MTENEHAVSPQRIPSRYVLCSAVVVLGVLVDQLSKYWARQELAERPLMIGSSEVGFKLAYNSGSAFSLFQSSTLILALIGIVIFAALCVAIVKAENTKIALCYAMIAAGAAGNLTDRFTQPPSPGRGLVTDFIKVGAWPTFNVADSLITMGIIFLIIATWTSSKRENNG